MEFDLFPSPGVHAWVGEGVLILSPIYGARSLSEKPRSGEMFIDRQAQLRFSSSFRSATDRLSPINGLADINGPEPFYKHYIPTGFLRQISREMTFSAAGWETRTPIQVSNRPRPNKDSRVCATQVVGTN